MEECVSVKATIIKGNCIEVLKTLPAESVNCCVTSPPYWGLRDYGVEGQLGLEQTPEEYVAKMVDVFSGVKRVLRDDGTLWLNVGDSYAANRSYQVASTKGGSKHSTAQAASTNNKVPNGLKPKDMVGIPWMMAFALRADGWYLRSEIIWAKKSCMPESVTDRPTKSHEQIFLLAKSQNYYYDAEAIREPIKSSNDGSIRATERERSGPVDVGNGAHMVERTYDTIKGANKRDVWFVGPQPYREAHFATFPPKLIEPCVLAGCPIGGTVLDPFGGSGTTGMVAESLGRNSILIELNPEYVELIKSRTSQQGMAI